MLEISYLNLFLLITVLWVITRAICCIKNKSVNWIHEAKLLSVYICLVVIARLVYFPMHLVDGKIANMVFDAEKVFPIWINAVPFVHMFEHYSGWVVNVIGNILMFVPVGLSLPFCFKNMNTLGKVVLAGAGFSLFIEISQLPFYERCSDIDDIILNTAGALIGASIYFVISNRKKKEEKATV